MFFFGGESLGVQITRDCAYKGCTKSRADGIDRTSSIRRDEHYSELADKKATMPGWTASNLSSLKYGYDFVVATTQASINATMKAFLSSRTEPIITVCYTSSEDGSPVPVDYDVLKKIADPFTIHIKDGDDPDNNTDLCKLKENYFMMGFRARLGLPRVTDPSKLPDIVTLESDTSAVLFHMICSEFTVVRLVPKGGYVRKTSWMNTSQPKDDPWVFTSKVDLRLSTVNENAYSNLPDDVKRKINNMGGMAFSVQQLLFDLTNASLMANVPTISGISSGTSLYTTLQDSFLGAYFKEMRKDGEPLLGCLVVVNDPPVSSLKLSAFKFHVNPYVGSNGEPLSKPTKDQAQLTTLNYLCAVGTKRVPSAAPFTWNWVDTISEQKDHHGAISINRNALVNYIMHRFEEFNLVKPNCIRPYVTVVMKVIIEVFAWTLVANQEPKITTPSTGNTVLRYDWDAESHDEMPVGIMGKFWLRCTYSLTVDFVDNKIVVTQHQVVHMKIVCAAYAEGNILDKQIVDTYDLGIDAKGKLTTSHEAVTTDNSVSLKIDPVIDAILQFNDLCKDIQQSCVGFVSSMLHEIPISVMQDFVFPGGKTFLFKRVGFSENQDLVSHITYADPTGPAHVAATS